MENAIVFAVLNAKYVHASPAPWCLAAGVKAYAPWLYSRVRVIEATVNQPLDEILAQISSANPAVVGLSCYLWNIDAVLHLCALLKQAMPDVAIILGGPEVSYCAADVLLSYPQVDYILAGEGEKSVPQFLTAMLSQRLSPDNIPGLCGRCQDGTPYLNTPAPLCADPPSPLTAGYAEAVGGRIAYFETSRGCPYSCAFCLSGRHDRPRFFGSESVFSDLLRLANSGTRTIKFVDRTFNANAEHANRILAFILAHYGQAIPQGVCFHFEIAGDILCEESFALLEQMPSGAVQLEIGMQSFHEKTLAAVNRKTNTTLLQSNIRRLVAMGNMHIHIDLIAGLPFEDLEVFAESFNKGFALKAQMLQLGFLKLLYGSAMRSQPKSYPCVFEPKAPYEVRMTPWLSQEDFALLHHTEDAVERVYNSGRFGRTIEYLLAVGEATPFDFFTRLGVAAHHAAVGGRVSLDDYTAFLQSYCAGLSGVDAEKLRDCLVRDRLSTNATGRLPSCLYRADPLLSKAVKHLWAHAETAPKKGVRRGVALLYAAKTVCWADYTPDGRDAVTGRWQLCEMALENF